MTVPPRDTRRRITLYDDDSIAMVTIQDSGKDDRVRRVEGCNNDDDDDENNNNNINTVNELSSCMRLV